MEFNLKKYLLIAVLIIFLLGTIELWYVKRKCGYKCALPKQYIVLTPDTTGFSNNIIVYNKNQVHQRDLGVTDNMKKIYIEEHVINKLTSPMKSIVSTISTIPETGMPINSLYNSFKTGDGVLSDLNPIGKQKGKYRMLVPVDLSVTGFISGKELYLNEIKKRKK